MTAYIITYDLKQEGQNYDCITKKLKSYGTHWHTQRSVWVIITDQSAIQIRDSLLQCLDSNDKLFVAELSGQAAWYGYSEKTGNWIQKHL